MTQKTVLVKERTDIEQIAVSQMARWVLKQPRDKWLHVDRNTWYLQCKPQDQLHLTEIAIGWNNRLVDKITKSWKEARYANPD